jgi:hypothetical protein
LRKRRARACDNQQQCQDTSEPILLRDYVTQIRLPAIAPKRNFAPGENPLELSVISATASAQSYYTRMSTTFADPD